MSKSTALAEATPILAAGPISGPAPDGPGPERRDRLRHWLKSQSLQGMSEDEVESHFAGMPSHYWAEVTEVDLLWGLGTIHHFFTGLAAPNAPGTLPVLDWRPLPGGDGTRVMLCTWDRRGLLAKAAACFSAANLNIQEAEVFTRSDHVVLDVFRVCESDGRGPAAPDKLEQVSFLLDGALSEPPRFASVWACSRHKFLAPRARFAPRIEFDNASSPSATLLHVQASDRLGLLYDLLQALADAGLNISQARIETDGAKARDVIQVTDAEGRKLTESSCLLELRRAIEAAITVND
jgi:[protein-PII] uridylyltransferase